MSASFAPRPSLIPSQQHSNVVPGAYFEDLIEVTGDASYPADGYAFGNTQLQAMYGGAYSTLVSVDVVNPWFSAAADTIFIAAYSRDEGTIQAFAQAVAGAATPLVEVTATTNMTTFVCTIRIRFF